MQRQLKAAKTRIRNLTFEANDAWAKAKANPASISKADRAKLLKVFAPDTGPHATEKQLTEAMQIFNAIKFNIK